jgi:acetyl esterase/lipase
MTTLHAVKLCLIALVFATSGFAQEDSQPSSSPSDTPVRGEYDFKKRGGIVYAKNDDSTLTCDVYVPEIEGPLPAVLVVHGGGWRSGTKFHWIRHARKMVKHGFVVVAINYRHAPSHKFPAQVHDVKQAVRFMRRHAQRYKIDPERIGAYGYSAGGHLVSMLGTTDSEDGLEGDVPEGYEEFTDTRIRCVVAGGAPTEFSWLGEDSRALNYWLGDGVTIRKNPELFQKAYPTSYISNDDPPFYFYHGTSDLVVPAKAAKVMHDKLTEAGVSSQFIDYEGTGHIALFSKTGEPLDRIIEFLDKHLAEEVDD